MKIETLVVIFTGACLFLSFPAMADTPLIGRESLEIAEHHQIFAEFDKSLVWCEKAISALTREIQSGKVDRSYLARAYYLKAFVLVSLGKPEPEIEQNLLKALLVDSEYEPPESFLSHPTVKKILERAKSAFYEQVDQAFDLGMELFTEEKYCEAKEVLQPIAHTYKNAELALKILKKCELKCQPADSEAPSPPPEEPAQTTEKPLEAEKETTEIFPMSLGVFPVTFEPGDSNLARYVEPDRLTATLAEYAPEFQFATHSQEDCRVWKEELAMESFHVFVIKKGRIYMEEKRDKLVDGVIVDMLIKGSNMGPVAVGELIPRLRKNMEKLFHKTGLKYHLFLKVASTEFGGSPKLNLEWCIYSCDTPAKPVVMGELLRLNLIKSSKRYQTIARKFKEYLDQVAPVEP